MKWFLASLTCAASAFAADRTHWPRLYPVIFVHGVNSSGAMWAVNLDEPAMGVKTNEYKSYKGELETLNKCSPHGYMTGLHGSNVPMLGSVWDCNGSYPVKQVTDASICGQTCTTDRNRVTTCTPNTCNAPQPANANLLWPEASSTPEITPILDFAKADVNAPFLTYFDRLQFDVTKRSRTFYFDTYKYYGNPKTGNFTPYGFPAFETAFPDVTARRNGMEAFSSYWQKSWVDGNPPYDLGEGEGGMLYGTYMTNPSYAPYARYSVQCEGNHFPLKPSDWNPTPRPVGWENSCLGYMGFISHSGPSVSTNAGVTTYKHTYYYGTGSYKFINFVQRPEGFTQEQFVEDSRFGQHGQLYAYVKKVLDKYYVDASGRPNWFTSNGNTDPEAKVILFGHSQGGVLSRSLMYPGFNTVDSFDEGQGYLPTYWPAAMVGHRYKDFDGSDKELTGWFDVRNHVAAVLTNSSPHMGSPVGFVLEGLLNLHKKSLADRASNEGLYAPVIDQKSIFSYQLNGEILNTLGTNFPAVVDYISPINVPEKVLGFHGLDETRVRSLRQLDPAPKPNLVTHNMLLKTPRNAGEGLAYWDQDNSENSPAENPCSPTGEHTQYYSNFSNYLRTFWQPEYDNWVRSFRPNEENNNGSASEKYLNPNAHNDFFLFSKSLCEEQIGDFSRLTTNANPYLLNGVIESNRNYNPFHPLNATPYTVGLAKAAASTSAAGGDVSKIQNPIDCLKSVAGRRGRKILASPLFLAPVRILTYPVDVYNDGEACVDKFIYSVNSTVAQHVNELMTFGAQGLTFHPAGQFLHKLNQAAGGSASMDRRPYPVTADGTPIPLISITNSFSGNQHHAEDLRSNNTSDMVVPTFSQDMGVIYPDFAKAGSHVRVHFTGYSHMDVGRMDERKFGPYFVHESNMPVDYDEAKNREHFKQSKITLAHMLLGIAAGQSPLILNPNGVGATRNEVVGKYTRAVNENGGEYRLQTNAQGVQGSMSRLKGFDKRLIRKPVVLPFDRNARIFYLAHNLEVKNGEELHIPAGSTLEFRPGGSITVRSGGTFTLGGTPDYASSGNSRRQVILKGAPIASVPVTFQAGALLRYPNSQTYRYYLVVESGGKRTPVRFKGGLQKLENPSTDLYRPLYEATPYLTFQVGGTLGFGKGVYRTSDITLISNLLD